MSQIITEGSYTTLVRQNATGGNLTFREAVQYLKNDARSRTVSETLARCCGMEGADRKALKKELLARLMAAIPGLNRDSMDRNLRNWLSDDTREISKGSAIQLAYALNLSLEDAEALLRRVSGEALHWRDPEDIIWIYGLDHGMQYGDVVALRDRAERAGLLKPSESESTDSMTAIVRQEIAQLTTEDELLTFLSEAAPRLGRMHNTAYMIFEGFLDLLQNAGEHTPGSVQQTHGGSNSRRQSNVPEERDMSMREIIATYMFNDYIPRSKRVGRKQKGMEETVLAAIQRNIRMNWPDETTLSRMRAREIDVTRKVMILLFMATDGGESEYADMADVEVDEVFQSMDARLDLMLADCGFAPLDSRSSFDWMILYCMCADESIFVDDYMQRFLSEIFSSAEGEA